MPTTRRSRVVAAEPNRVWSVVGDAHHLPRWWPRVERVEGVGKGAFTTVMRSDRGRSVRADYRVTEQRQPHARRWVQDVEGTPFERFLASSETAVELAPRDGGTEVTLSVRQQMRGMARFGGFLVRGAAKRQLDEALDGLEQLL
jgi:uncharacterized protein YndB with AHSA1/START domain